jgi:hypothetical protein
MMRYHPSYVLSHILRLIKRWPTKAMSRYSLSCAQKEFNRFSIGPSDPTKATVRDASDAIASGNATTLPSPSYVPGPDPLVCRSSSISSISSSEVSNTNREVSIIGQRLQAREETEQHTMEGCGAHDSIVKTSDQPVPVPPRSESATPTINNAAIQRIPYRLKGIQPNISSCIEHLKAFEEILRSAKRLDLYLMFPLALTKHSLLS